ncbi:hypothetical protein B0H19DRAFT_1117220 [Mycena capillaripes]|nr:hypothetical protein B0H19DRAFT_1204544 [Mycena capillaripes]KAJ6581999.1 hypothetical protein B0H19DRAFT_1117220 [Mycena capillaripes]
MACRLADLGPFWALLGLVQARTSTGKRVVKNAMHYLWLNCIVTSARQPLTPSIRGQLRSQSITADCHLPPTTRVT